MVLRHSYEGLRKQVGPFLFEFQRFGLAPTPFLSALDRFFPALPPGRPYAVEVRHPAILGPRYRDLLRAHGIAQVCNHWNAMPPLAMQHVTLGRRFTAPFVVIRLLTPLGMAFDEAVTRYAPYDRLVQPIPRMRTDALALVRQAMAEGQSAYVPVNNRSEGNAPSTIQAPAEQLSRRPFGDE